MLFYKFSLLLNNRQSCHRKFIKLEKKAIFAILLQSISRQNTEIALNAIQNISSFLTYNVF